MRVVDLRRGLRAGALAIVAFAAPDLESSAGVEDLVSPGPLIEAHAREAHDCSDCHQRFQRGAQSKLCLVCHEPIAADLEAGSGYHGRLPGGPDTPCRACHSEHHGADASLIALAPESFDHDRTDMRLEGRHARVACSACHPAGKLHRDAPKECIGCHREDDAHAGRLGEGCGDCHSPAGWREAVFDHQATKFPLEGRHADVECALCHPQERFEGTPLDCASCHRIDDAHGGRLGSDCGRCHDARGWRKAAFDHRRETGFALAGRHASLRCNDCHHGDPRREKLDKKCTSCHAGDDDHLGRFGADCGHCHGAASWARPFFDHAKAAHYPLKGAHADLACALCHVRATKGAATPSRCVDCHVVADVHAGAEGSRCEQCHTPTGWRPAKAIDHDLTRFPLLGLHRAVACEDCHTSAEFANAPNSCEACHASRDVHKGRLGPDCALCHSPQGWPRWRFDHNRQTRFVLNGAHAGLDCTACHRKAVASKIELATSCRACHLPDSPHSDAFGRDCERCHSERSWKEILHDL